VVNLDAAGTCALRHCIVEGEGTLVWWCGGAGTGEAALYKVGWGKVRRGFLSDPIDSTPVHSVGAGARRLVTLTLDDEFSSRRRESRRGQSTVISPAAASIAPRPSPDHRCNIRVCVTRVRTPQLRAIATSRPAGRQERTSRKPQIFAFHPLLSPARPLS
jgi:hypothetical protein